MATRTLDDLVIKILENLGVVPEGQAPEVEDTARIKRSIPSLFEELAAREIVYVADSSTINDAWLLSLAAIAAYEFRGQFGVNADDEIKLKAANDEAISKIKVMTRGRPTFEPLKTLSF